MYKKLLSVIAAVAVLGVSPAFAAQPQSDHKVTICHGTNSVKNPYVRITVDDDAADGNTGNDSGRGDHSTHTGPVATSEAQAQQLKDSKTAWGDIIPPHDNYGGLNWTAEGQAIYNNGCNYVNGGRGGALTTTTPDQPAAPAGEQQVKTTPAQGVSAGGGWGSGSTTSSLAGLAISLMALGYGLRRFQKS